MPVNLTKQSTPTNIIIHHSINGSQDIAYSVRLSNSFLYLHTSKGFNLYESNYNASIKTVLDLLNNDILTDNTTNIIIKHYEYDRLYYKESFSILEWLYNNKENINNIIISLNTKTKLITN